MVVGPNLLRLVDRSHPGNHLRHLASFQGLLFRLCAHHWHRLWGGATASSVRRKCSQWHTHVLKMKLRTMNIPQLSAIGGTSCERAVGFNRNWQKYSRDMGENYMTGSTGLWLHWSGDYITWMLIMGCEKRSRTGFPRHTRLPGENNLYIYCILYIWVEDKVCMELRKRKLWGNGKVVNWLEFEDMFWHLKRYIHNETVCLALSPNTWVI